MSSQPHFTYCCCVQPAAVHLLLLCPASRTSPTAAVHLLLLPIYCCCSPTAAAHLLLLFTYCCCSSTAAVHLLLLLIYCCCSPTAAVPNAISLLLDDRAVTCWLLYVQALCWCISGTDPLRQVYALPQVADQTYHLIHGKLAPGQPVQALTL